MFDFVPTNDPTAYPTQRYTFSRAYAESVARRWNREGLGERAAVTELDPGNPAMGYTATTADGRTLVRYPY